MKGHPSCLQAIYSTLFTQSPNKKNPTTLKNSYKYYSSTLLTAEINVFLNASYANKWHFTILHSVQTLLVFKLGSFNDKKDSLVVIDSLRVSGL